jgi:cathepsin C
MVYDEGFSLNFPNLSFFAFSKYIIQGASNQRKIFSSQCYQTCVGWYVSTDNQMWGCYKALKHGVDDNSITYVDSKNMVTVLEPTQIINSRPIINSPNNLNLINSLFKQVETENNKLSSFLSEKENIKLSLFAGLTLNSSFNSHHLYVERLNMLDKSWKAEVHPEFSNQSILQLNKFAGLPRFKTIEKQIPIQIRDTSVFPPNFDWRSLLREAGSQGNCGSCYAYSTIRMVEARLKLKYNHDVKLSVQHALDCSIYNQGCEGGYPFLVMKFANEFELLPEYCKPYAV